MATAYAQLGLTLDVLSGPLSATKKPKAGQTVSIKYKGTLASGSVFDTNEDKEPLTVRVGRGQVVSGWDAMLPHIAVGQRVRLTVPPALAYGAKGKAGVIPPNATLTFEIELLSIEADTPAEALLEAASTGSVDGVVHSLRDGADVEHADRQGHRALHLAAKGGHVEIVMRLLEAVRVGEHRTTACIGNCCSHTRTPTRAAHASQGAAVDPLTKAGVTPLMFAVSKSAEPLCAKLLLHARADVNIKSLKGTTALALLRKDKEHAALETEYAGGSAGRRASAGDVSGLGIGYSDPVWLPGWEVLRNRALWRARVRRDNPRCWLKLVVEAPAGTPAADVAAAEADAPAVEVELYADVVPRTSENFRCLCTGERGTCSTFGSPPLHFKGSVSHRIVPGNILQAGDITMGDGRGGESIYGRKFDDESFGGRAGKHTSKGLLSMANSGRNSNGSQFFITLDALPHLDGKHVVFGRVLSGMEFVEAIVGAVGSSGGVPSRKVVITDCGQLPSESGVLV